MNHLAGRQEQQATCRGGDGQTDGAATKFKTKFETEVNLNIGLKPDFSVQIKHWFKT